LQFNCALVCFPCVACCWPGGLSVLQFNSSSFFFLRMLLCVSVVGLGVGMSSSRVTWFLFAVTVAVLVWGLWAVGGLDDACVRGRTVC
jgi:hypothetical protein